MSIHDVHSANGVQDTTSGELDTTRRMHLYLHLRQHTRPQNPKTQKPKTTQRRIHTAHRPAHSTHCNPSSTIPITIPTHSPSPSPHPHPHTTNPKNQPTTHPEAEQTKQNPPVTQLPASGPGTPRNGDLAGLHTFLTVNTISTSTDS